MPVHVSNEGTYLSIPLLFDILDWHREYCRPCPLYQTLVTHSWTQKESEDEECNCHTYQIAQRSFVDSGWGQLRTGLIVRVVVILRKGIAKLRFGIAGNFFFDLSMQVLQIVIGQRLWGERKRVQCKWRSLGAYLRLHAVAFSGLVSLKVGLEIEKDWCLPRWWRRVVSDRRHDYVIARPLVFYLGSSNITPPSRYSTRSLKLNNL